MDGSLALVRVVKIQDEGQVASIGPEQLEDRDLRAISGITNKVVKQLQQDLILPRKEERVPGIGLSEIELEFGIDLSMDVEGSVKIPIVGPRVRGGVHGGATFAVRITLTLQ